MGRVTTAMKYTVNVWKLGSSVHCTVRHDQLAWTDSACIHFSGNLATK